MSVAGGVPTAITLSHSGIVAHSRPLFFALAFLMLATLTRKLSADYADYADGRICGSLGIQGLDETYCVLRVAYPEVITQYAITRHPTKSERVKIVCG